MSSILSERKMVFSMLLLLFLSCCVSSTEARTLDNFQVERRMTQSKACFEAYKNVAYSLWKHLCGTQTAGKRDEYVIPEAVRADGDVNGLQLSTRFQANNKPQKLDLMQVIMESLAGRNDEDKDIYY